MSTGHPSGTHQAATAQQGGTHHGQGRPKLLIGVAGKVHVVHDDDAALAKRGHRPAQLEDLPAGRVREDQVKLAGPTGDLGPVPRGCAAAIDRCGWDRPSR
jgi:hypothetical protein